MPLALIVLPTVRFGNTLCATGNKTPVKKETLSYQHESLFFKPLILLFFIKLAQGMQFIDHNNNNKPANNNNKIKAA